MFMSSTIVRLAAAVALASLLATSGFAQSITNAIWSSPGCATMTSVLVAGSVASVHLASNCELLYTDRATVLLPQLTGTVPYTVTVRNVSNTNIYVEASSPDGIDGTVVGYASSTNYTWLPPGAAAVCCTVPGVYIQPQGAVTFSAFPAALPNAWFTTSDR